MGQQLHGIGFSDDWIRKQLQMHRKKEKNRLIGLYENRKNLCIKNTISKVKRQLAEWEEIFSNCVSDEGLISKYTKYFYN